MALAERRGVEAAVVGEFTDSGCVEVFYRENMAARLSLEFLHHGLPVMRLKAEWVPPKVRGGPGTSPDGEGRSGDWLHRDRKEQLLALLSEPNIASKECLVRQYDHEVKAQSVVKPFTGVCMDGPSDGAVLKPLYDSWRGITVTHGICPRYGDIDTYHMAMCAVDEAFRAHISCGGHPDFACVLDNFCWPDPVQSESTPDGGYKLAQLVRACRGLHDACLAYGLPLISGKDSMKNDALIGGKKVSVRPTLLISLMGMVPDVRKAVTTDFQRSGDVIFLLGATRGELGGSVFERITGGPMGGCPAVNTGEAKKLYCSLYRAIEEGLVSSCHDLSDGGLGVALAESVLGGRKGAEIDIGIIAAMLGGMAGSFAESVDDSVDDILALFSETPSRFIITTPPSKAAGFLSMFKGQPVWEIGKVTETDTLRISSGNKQVLRVSMEEIKQAWKGGLAV
jgi:phosphoribosylformylglycinamidine synthase